MKNKIRILAIIALLAFTSIGTVWAYTESNKPSPSVTVYNKSKAFNGYTLFAPINGKDTYLINNKGQVVHQWHSNFYPGVEVSLLPNGELMRTIQITPTDFKMGGAGGGVELLDWNSNVVYNYVYSSSDYIQHHDAEVMPNGHILMLTWDKHTRDEAIAAGVDPANIDPKTNTTWSESVIEVDPTNSQIVWQWKSWDHLIQNFDSTQSNFNDVKSHPELINANYYKYSQKPDWMHANSIDFNPKLNQIIISVREFNEVWIIDHSTTTVEAASHDGGASQKGGDLLYRWGNPEVYDQGTTADRKLFLQHDAKWIPDGLSGAGNILIFNDGDPTRPYSSVDEIAAPIDGSYGTAPIVWEYTAPHKTDFYASYLSSAERLPNGDTLICGGPLGLIFEVTPTGQTVWKFQSPIVLPSLLNPSQQVKDIFRAYKYPTDYPAFNGKNLTPTTSL